MVLNNQNALLSNLHFKILWEQKRFSVFILDEKTFPERRELAEDSLFLPKESAPAFYKY